MMDQLNQLLWILAKIIIVVLPLVVFMAYLTTIERKVISYMQLRIGPNRVGIRGIGQPIADAIKLICKEIVVPTASNKYLFVIAPMLAIAPALAAWAVIPFTEHWVLANVDAGVLYLFAMTSIGIYAILIGGWASNSKYAFYGALRAAAQAVSYEIAMGFALVGVLLAADTMNLRSIVMQQHGSILHWYWLPLFPLFVVYWISAVAETNRAPFDVAEGESEIVAGFHVEYGGIAFGLFFLAEYINMILISTIASIMFLGGWLSPFEGIPMLAEMTAWIPGLVWLCMKTAIFLFLYIWMRATFPRYRYDQIMHLGWKVLIPVTLVWITVIAFAVQLHLPPWFN